METRPDCDGGAGRPRMDNIQKKRWMMEPVPSPRTTPVSCMQQDGAKKPGDLGPPHQSAAANYWPQPGRRARKMGRMGESIVLVGHGLLQVPLRNSSLSPECPVHRDSQQGCRRCCHQAEEINNKTG
ncbi:uncharacterized protein ACJ7VT_006913 [Polymixia lowei]